MNNTSKRDYYYSDYFVFFSGRAFVVTFLIHTELFSARLRHRSFKINELSQRVFRKTLFLSHVLRDRIARERIALGDLNVVMSLCYARAMCPNS